MAQRPTRRSAAAAADESRKDDARKVAKRSSAHRAATNANAATGSSSSGVAATTSASSSSLLRRSQGVSPPVITTMPTTRASVSSRKSRRKAPVSPKRSHSNSPVLKDLPSAPSSPPDRLSPLSAELLALILTHLSPRSAPDLTSLYHLALVGKSLVPHVRQHMYRDLRIDTRVNAHAMHRTLHGNDVNKAVKTIEADVGTMAKTSSQWVGWFLFHSMHSLCGIIGSCRTLLTLTLYLPETATAWTQSLCSALIDLKMLHTLIKDLEPSREGAPGAGRAEGMDVGWRPRKSTSMWSVSQLLKPLSTLRSLQTLRLCGISSDSSTNPPTAPHSLRLTEVVLIEVNITNTDLLHLLGNAASLKKLTLWRSSLLSKRGLTHVLRKCPSLVELKVGGSWFGAKDEDDTNFPLDASLPHLPHLRTIHVSGSLISPAILLLPCTNLEHLLVHSAPAFTPQAIHHALARMRSDPSPVAKLTLPEMVLQGGDDVRDGDLHSTGIGWTEHWLFTVKATAEAKGVTLENGRDGREDDSDSDSDPA